MTGMDPEHWRPTRASRAEDLPLFAAPKAEGYRAELDRERLVDARSKVLALMLDMQWHTIQELRTVGGSSGDRRLRELRALGFRIEKVRDPGMPVQSGIFRYKLLEFSIATWRHALESMAPRPKATP